MYRIKKRWGVRIPLRDGVKVVADLFLPITEGTVPAIVVRTPYGRSSNGNIEQAEWFAERGYAVMVVDVRGRGDSEGTFIPYRNEGVDGYDTIEWAAAQPWCDGHVGTLGGSYLGKIQWLTALTHPPHLKAMIPIVSPSDPFVEWPTGSPDPMHVCWQFLTSDRALQNINQVDWEEVYTHLPLMTMDEAAGREMPLWKELFEHCQLDSWWDVVRYQNRFDEIDLPVLHISGWYDDEQIGTPLNFAGMTTKAPSEFARGAQRLIMGPWGHNVNASTRVGDLDFGQASVIDLRGRQLRFFDHWLQGKDNGLESEKPVEIFIMGKNQWRQESEWPLQRTAYTPIYLHSNGKANSRFGDGTLTNEKPQNETADRYTYDPENAVPFLTEPTSSQIGGPDDYSAVHRRDDVLVYTSAPLDEELEVTGPVKAQLYASTSAPDTDFMVQLHDLWPNGYAQRLCDGMVRVRFRKGMANPEFVEPEKIECYEIDCWNTAHVFLPGHRIVVHVTSSAFPKYDRNPNTDKELGRTMQMEKAAQRIYHDAEHPSAVILPIIK
ncbi:CocE/NonD family hydrolase [Alicyclobacillus sp. SO9]|uniref:CocE/NonD family hydrolase n=1 Tax=Alicyclobacillus sp. SO9 TaxID=2665646 RepID=UPI0018E7F2D6|nr:CocE/NonD family hydrolase [Alicyclobacillus sp. SO9]QQE79186.1 CocE/NonD family hydrolase [Alicyclobacillus sp. SO9]